MRWIVSVVQLVLFVCASRWVSAATDASSKHDRPTEAYGRVPLSFEPNLGQTDGRVQWVARGQEYALFLSGHDAVLELNSITPKKGIADRPKIDSAVVRMNLLGAKTVKQTEGEEPQPGKANYFTGRVQSKWLREVPMFGKVRLREVYPGIDLVYYGRQGRLEYDFVVAPGADPTKIGLEFDGAKAGLGANGDLVLPIAGGESWKGEKEIRFDRPTVYQMKDGVREPVAGAFRVESDGRVSFALGEYDRRRELVIDPTLIFEGEIGTGNQQTIPTGMAVDSAGEMVITGYTNDLTFPTTTGAYQTTCSSPTDPFVVNGMTRCGASSAPSAFVTKLSADGTTLVYSTYLHGGGGYEQGQSVAVDAAGDAYVLGSTSSNDFPITANAYQTTCLPYASGTNGAAVSECDNFSNGGGTEYTVNGPTLFIAKLNPLGTALLYSTFFGGSAAAYPIGIALDSANNIYFASDVNPGLAADNLYVNNPNKNQIQFPVTTNAYQTVGIGLQEPALSKLSADGQTLLYSTFLGSMTEGQNNYSLLNAFALGQNGVMFVGGWTYASDFPTTAGSIKPSCALNPNNALSCSNAQGIVAAIDTTKSGAASLVYSTYLGGNAAQGSNIPEQEVYGLLADASNDLFVTGYTYANDFPTTSGTFQTSCPSPGNSGSCSETAFLTKINPAGSALTWSTFVGGTSTNPASSYGSAIALDGPGNVYLYGFSQDGGGDFPQVNPLQPYSSGNKVFVTTFTADGTTLLFGTRFGTSSTTTGSGTTPIANGIAVDATGNMYIVGYTNDSGTFGTTPGTYSTPATNGFNRTFFAKISPATTPVPANGITTNLLLNPGAELGSIADWTPGGDGTPTVDQGTFDPGINPHSGSYDFLGQSGAADSLSQTVSILQQGITAAQVDSNTLFASVSFWEQGLNQGTPSDDGSVTVTFLNASNAAISSMTTATVDSHDGTWANGTGLFAIPAGTRLITYTMNFMRNRGSDNDSFIDDNSLTIVADAGLTISPAALHFGNVAVGQASAAQTVTLTNQQPSLTTIDISQIVSDLGANPSDFPESNNCPAALVAGASCTVTITFVPDGVGAKSAGIAINTDSIPPQQQILVDGTGIGAVTTATTLAVTSGGGAVTTVAAGSLVTLTATVETAGVPVSPGQVAFCDATAAQCTDVHLLGTAQLTIAGVATYRFVPGIGAHSYKAVFLGTKVATASASSAVALTVTGKYPTATTIAETGIPGNYMLTATTVGTSPLLTGPTGGISFLDTSNSNAVLGMAALGAGTAAFSLAQPMGSPVAVGGGPYGMATGDFNGDGFADVAVENYYSGTVSVLLGNGDGTFQPQVTYPVGALPERVLVADMNGDGKLDLVVANTGSSTIGVLLGNGDGTFQPQVTYPCGSPVGLGVMDVNHDGIPDVVAGDYYENTMSVLLGNGDGTLKPAVTYPTGGTPQTVAEGDFNGDGNVDVAVGNESGGTVGIFLGNGDGTFQAMVTYAVGNLPQGIQVGDFNADGKADLAVANNGDGTISVLVGNGDGTFQPQATYPVGVQPVGLAVADFNGDGIEDITVGNTGQASLTQSVLLGKGDGTFQPQLTFPTGNFPYGVAVGDFNGDGLPDMVVANFIDATATIFLSQPTETATASLPGVSPPGTGTHLVVASYPSDAHYGSSLSATTPLTGVVLTPVISWMPAVATISYGAVLGASQLNATATTSAGATIPGTFAYTPAAGSMLMAGTQTLSVTFTPNDMVDYTTAMATATITVTQAGPTISWAAPASIVYGTPLSATQLDATATGVNGTALAGTFLYTPASGAVLTPGTQTLNVAFTPTDGVDYTAAKGSTTLVVVSGLTLSAIAPTSAPFGSAATTVMLTGSGFVPTSMAQVNGTAIPTTYVSGTTLTAVIPATDLTTLGTLNITVSDPSAGSLPGATSAAQAFTVVAAPPAVTLTGPATTTPGSQPAVALTITNPYPLPLTAVFTLTFTAAGSAMIDGQPVDDPAIQFMSGGRSFTLTIPANTTVVPPVDLQAGTDAGTITISLALTANGVNVTPASLGPVTIAVPAIVPTLTGASVTRKGDLLTVVVHGFSNTREVSQASFVFTAEPGDTIATPNVNVPATMLFGTWFGSAESLSYGSTFTYTQIFNLSADATTIRAVGVTLTNSVGTSAMMNSQ